MDGMFFSACDVAKSVRELNLRYSTEMYLINKIWICEKNRLEPVYRKDLKKFILDVMLRLHSAFDNQTLVKEYKKIIQEENIESELFNRNQSKHTVNEFYIFKRMRIRYLYDNKKSYMRVKKKSIMDMLGCANYSLYDVLKKAMEFYSISFDKACDIEQCSSDSFLTFKIMIN